MKKIKYTEPSSYFPKAVRDKYFGKPKAKSTSGEKKTSSKKKTK